MIKGQHFIPVEYFGGEEAFAVIIERDKKKYELCKKHGINIIYIIDDYYMDNDYLIENYKDKNIVSFKKYKKKLKTEFQLANN